MPDATQNETECLVIAPPQRLDATTSMDFEKRCAGAIDAGKRKLVVDFSAVDYVSSAGLRALLNIVKKQSTAGGVLALCSLKPAVQEIISLSGFDMFLSLYPNQAAAIQAKDCRMPGRA